LICGCLFGGSLGIEGGEKGEGENRTRVKTPSEWLEDYKKWSEGGEMCIGECEIGAKEREGWPEDLEEWIAENEKRIDANKKRIEMDPSLTKVAERQIECVWLWRDPKSTELVVKRSPPSGSLASVPAIRVLRDGCFEIRPLIRDYLDYHPLLAIPGGGKSADDCISPLILQALDTIEKISGLDVIHFASAPPLYLRTAGQIAAMLTVLLQLNNYESFWKPETYKMYRVMILSGSMRR